MDSEAAGQFHEALSCPICPSLFVESLWSLIAHINASHRENPLILDYHSLQRLKKVVPKTAVCVIRPAFNVDGSRTDFLNFFADGSVGHTADPNPPEAGATTPQQLSSVPPRFRRPSVSQSVSPEPVSLDLSLPTKSSSPSKSPLDSPQDLPLPTPSTISGGNKRVKRHSPYPRPSKKQICQKCGELFDNRCLLTLHMMVHKRKTHPFQCPISGCFQCYDSKMKFRSHLNRVHRELTPVKMEALMKAAANETTENERPSSEMPLFDEHDTSKSATEQLAETVEKVIKQELMEP